MMAGSGIAAVRFMEPVRRTRTQKSLENAVAVPDLFANDLQGVEVNRIMNMVTSGNPLKVVDGGKKIARTAFPDAGGISRTLTCHNSRPVTLAERPAYGTPVIADVHCTSSSRRHFDSAIVIPFGRFL